MDHVLDNIVVNGYAFESTVVRDIECCYFGTLVLFPVLMAR